jgi:hypothetical protein
MKRMYTASLLVITLIACDVLHAATFTVKNEGSETVKVNPQWSGREGGYDTLQPGQTSGTYNSGLNSPSSIKWLSVVKCDPQDKHCDKKLACYKAWEAGIKMWNLNLGAKFYVINDGSYRYEFGVDGSSGGTAQNLDATAA